METPSVSADSHASRRYRIWLGLILLGLGLLGHLLAARAIGGTYVAFRDHIFGFVMLLLVSGAIIAGLGWRFWRSRNDITLLTIGAVQALLGFFVYIERFHVHG
jgi:hypothetical protein